MILDNIINMNRYIFPYQDKIISYLQNKDLILIPDGEHDIMGRDLFVRVMSYIPKPAHENNFESHRMYADLQYVAKGIELMQVAPIDQLTAITEYDAVKEYQFFKAHGCVSDLVVREGDFTVYFPGEAHRPSCRYLTYEKEVKKFVFKIRII